MPALPGTVINSRIVPTDSLDTYSTHDAQFGRDGWRSVDDITERDAIYDPRRKEGMVVWVKSEDKVYQLKGGITNSDWVEFSSGSGSISGDYVLVAGDTMTGTLSMSGAGIQLDTAHTPTWAEGKIFYDGTNHTLAYYNDNAEVTINVGQEEVVRVRNSTGSTIANGKVVYVSGSTGNHPNITLASNNTVSAHSTLGVATHDINHNEDGYITVSGLVNGLNTNSFSAEGVTLWLGVNGALTETEPTAPTHKVKIGYLIRKHPTQGRILVSIDSGNDLSDLHDVQIGDTEDGDLLVKSGAIWTPGANINDYTTLAVTSSISGDLQGQINNKQNNITLLAGSNIIITESPTDTWTISASISGGTIDNLDGGSASSIYLISQIINSGGA